jgi:superfamily II DNA or RNA helicase
MIPIGLIPDLANFAIGCGYKCKIDSRLAPRGAKSPLSIDDVSELCNDLKPYDKDKELTYYDYQLKYIHHALNANRAVLLSPTSSGKSLMLYSITRILSDNNLVDGKILVIVPDVGLIHQMFGDFANYSNKQINEWNVLQKVHCIYAGQQKDTDKQIVVSTYQSLMTIEDPEYFKQFEAVFVDECHLAKANVIKGIMEKCTEAWVKIGLTGTLDGEAVNELLITGLFGPPVEFIKTHQMIEMGAATRLEIKPIFFVYDDVIKEQMSGCDYKSEIRFLVNSKSRNRELVELAASLPGNTLILGNYIEHGQLLTDLIRDRVDWEVINIDGRIDGKIRKEMQDHIGTLDKSTTIATYKTLSTGVNVKNFHNIIFAHPSKGRIRILQSIGRGLRKHESKDKITLYDVVDDLRFKGIVNYAVTHFAARMATYAQQKFNVAISIRKVND